ncbi:MAG: sugar ABC transporter permease [Lachnospiraceae bacterium]|nr:sugar ABC transporter permease [Lachnospiraceae bacterium]
MATEKAKQKKLFAQTAFARYFLDFGEAIAKGDWAVKASLGVMGMSFFKRKQIAKGVLVTLVQLAYLLCLILFSIPNLAKFSTLGTVQYQDPKINPLTFEVEQFPYDNSFLILIYGIASLFLLFVFLLYYVHNVKRAYAVMLDEKNGKHVNSFKEDLKQMLGKKFHVTLMSIPAIGVVLMNILPLLVLIAIAFTNYDKNHMPPGTLFTWVGFENFTDLFGGKLSLTFGYAFKKVLAWTLTWAFLATFTCFIGGILLALLINSEGVKLPKMWRTLFVIAIAVPQFVTLILVRNFFADQGIFNQICQNLGILDLCKNLGLVNKNAVFIPFLTDKNWTKVMIILINIWVGIPYQMLIATGVLMNAPKDQLESARIDGANKWKIFWRIIIPYILVVQGPALITDFVRNINNFNVIYLLTQDVYITQDAGLYKSNAKEVDLLVTWLFRLTQEEQNYKMASVIGIIVFVISVVFTLISYSRLMKGGREEDYQI